MPFYGKLGSNIHDSSNKETFFCHCIFLQSHTAATNCSWCRLPDCYTFCAFFYIFMRFMSCMALLNLVNQHITSELDWISHCDFLPGGHKPGKPGILRDFSEHGKLREFCATPGKNCNKQSIFSLSFKYLVRMQWWPVILLELMWNDPWWRSLLCLLFVVITYGKVSLWLWKSLANSGDFFLLICGHPVLTAVCLTSVLQHF